MTAQPAESDRADVYRMVLDALPEPVLIYDDTQVLYVNAAACRALRAADPTQLVGMRVTNFTLPELAQVSTDRRAYVMQQGVELKDLPIKIRLLDGEPVVFHVDIKPIDFDGTPAAMATLTRR